MLNKENNQNISDVENSTVNQAGRDVTIVNNNGLQAKDVIAIVDHLVSSKLAEYSSKAQQTAHQRSQEFSVKLVEEVTKKVMEKIDRFEEPSIQYATRVATLGYIKSGDAEQKENLVDLLIERVKAKEGTTLQQVIDQAIEVLPKLSKLSLALLVLLAYRNLNFIGNINEFNNWLKSINPILNVVNQVGSLDISYLNQCGCAIGMSGLNVYDDFLNSFIKSNNLYCSHSISGEQYKTFLQMFNLQEIQNGLQTNIGQERFLELFLFFSVNINIKEITPSVNSTQVIKSIQDLEMRNHLLDAAKLFTSMTLDEVRQKLISVNSNWDKAIDLLNRNDVRCLHLTAVGNYIAARQLSKLSNKDITMDLFYRN